jgi:hypothetical protein
LGFAGPFDASLFVLILGAAVSAACSGENVKAGGGPLVYAASETIVLRPRETGATLGVVVPGLRNIETIESETGVALTVPPTSVSSCSAYPVTIAGGDVDSDGVPEIGIMDPSCGNWIATTSGNEFVGRKWSDLLPEMPTHSSLTIDNVDHESDVEVVGASASAITLLKRSDGAWLRTDMETGGYPYLGSQQVRSLFAHIGPGKILFQHHGFFSLVDLDRPGESARRLEQDLDSATWLRPFLAFDHLSPYSLPECPPAMLGIGLASPYSGPVPREIQILTVEGEAVVRVADSGLREKGVQALSIVERRGVGEYLVGFINEEVGVTQFALATLTSCDQLVKVASRDVEFDWKTPQAPRGYEMPSLPRRGVVLAGMEAPSGARFFHYDGFSLRMFLATHSDGGWTISSTRTTIHEVREDVAW